MRPLRDTTTMAEGQRAAAGIVNVLLVMCGFYAAAGAVVALIEFVL